MKIIVMGTLLNIACLKITVSRTSMKTVSLDSFFCKKIECVFRINMQSLETLIAKNNSVMKLLECFLK
jgi:hypothetical protein